MKAQYAPNSQAEGEKIKGRKRHTSVDSLLP